MPWHIETNNSQCASGYAVVKDDDGSVEGCHRTRREALAQLAALAITSRCRLVSFDADFQMFEGLNFRHLALT